jgi:hypothetical protein
VPDIWHGLRYAPRHNLHADIEDAELPITDAEIPPIPRLRVGRGPRDRAIFELSNTFRGSVLLKCRGIRAFARQHPDIDWQTGRAAPGATEREALLIRALFAGSGKIPLGSTALAAIIKAGLNAWPSKRTQLWDERRHA